MPAATQTNTDAQQSLAAFFDNDQAKFALLIIDVQKQFAAHAKGYNGSTHTHAIATDIAKLTPQFRAANTPVFIVYTTDNDEPYEQAYGGPHLLKTTETDIKVPKTENSAITSSNLPQELEKQGITHIFVMGFNASACVFETVEDALNKTDLQIALLHDTIGESHGNHADSYLNLNYLSTIGATITDTQTALTHLTNTQPR